MLLDFKTLATVSIVAALASAEITEAEAASLELFWSYGRSESVYPTPEGVGLGDWADAYSKAKALVDQMTNEEKSNMTYGFATTANGCSGVSGSVPRLGFPGICVNDAGGGVRGTDMVSSYPSALHVGASWNKNLANNRGYYIGKEFETKGVNVMLGPVVGPVGKTARGGRNWEGFSNDPYLTGSLVYETIIGAQENVATCVKHFLGYEQEQMRGGLGFNNSVSINLDDATMHELYLWPFQDAVHAGTGSVMISYNRINNSYASQNSKTINGLLKGELGFQGFVMTDWDAQRSGVASANSGLDMAMPSSTYWGDGNLTDAVSNGTVSQDRLDDMATRILATYYQYSNENATGQGMPYDMLEPHTLVNAIDPASKETIFQGAVEGHVLVKNVDNTLPLSHDLNVVSVFGYDAGSAPLYTDNVNYGELWGLNIPNTLTWTNGSTIDPTELLAIFLSERDPSELGPGVALNGTLFTGGGSGSNTPSYIDTPLDAFARQAYEDGFFLAYDTVNQNPNVQDSDVCFVFVNELASEGWDRPNLADPYSDVLVQNVASQCSNTVVVVHHAGIRVVDSWIENENITAVIFGHLPGQDSGRSLIEILWGNQSPSGRLPYTVAKNSSDYGILESPILPQDNTPYYPQDNATEGVYIDYKHFLKQGIEPRFEFGFGLTYSEFEYSDLNTTMVAGVNTDTYPPGSDVIAEGGVASLWDVIVTVSCTVENTGNYTAAEVAQLYVGIPDGPERVLRGYNKQGLESGESSLFTFDLTRRDLSYWDTAAQQWNLQSGDYNIYVGKSVLDIQLNGTIFI